MFSMLAPQGMLSDVAPGSTHKCRLPLGMGSCSPVPACEGSIATFDMADRTPSFASPGAKRGTITVFTTADGDVVVTATTACNCFLAVSGSNGNSIFLGSNYNIGNATAQASSCPAKLGGTTDPTDTSSLTAMPSVATCMSWVLPKTRVQATMAGSTVPGTVTLTMHFAVSCYSSCGTLTLTSQTNIISSGDPADVRCEIQPFRGMVYRVPSICTTTPPQAPSPLPPPPPPPPPADATPPPPSRASLLESGVLPDGEFVVYFRCGQWSSRD